MGDSVDKTGGLGGEDWVARWIRLSNQLVKTGAFGD